MKKVLFSLSLLVISAHASNDHMSELQRALARRRGVSAANSRSSQNSAQSSTAQAGSGTLDVSSLPAPNWDVLGGSNVPVVAPKPRPVAQVVQSKVRPIPAPRPRPQSTVAPRVRPVAQVSRPTVAASQGSASSSGFGGWGDMLLEARAPLVHVVGGPGHAQESAPSYSLDGVPFTITSNGVLRIEGKGIKDISGLRDLTAADKAKVKVLSLSNNQIASIPIYIFEGFQHLVKLDLSYNRISELKSGDFLNQWALQELNISHNQIKKMDQYLGLKHSVGNRVLSGLKKLNLSHNKLTQITPAFFKQETPNIQDLNLSYNLIDDVPAQAFHNLIDLKELHVEGNPLKGDISLDATNLSTLQSLQRIHGLPPEYLEDALNARHALNVPVHQRLQVNPDPSFWQELDIPNARVMLDKIINVLSGN